MLISDTPGLGIDLAEAAIAEHPFVPCNLRHYDSRLTDIRPPGRRELFHFAVLSGSLATSGFTTCAGGS